MNPAVPDGVPTPSLFDMSRRSLFAIALAVIATGTAGATPRSGVSAAVYLDGSGIVLLASIAAIEAVLIAFLLDRYLRERSSGSESPRQDSDSRKADAKREADAPGAEFGSRLIHAQEQESSRIARELHDDISQRLVLLADGLERLRHSPEGVQSAQGNSDLEYLWKLVNEIAIDIQNISHRLHPSKLYFLGLSAAVRGLCHEFARQREIEVECNVRDVPVDLDENTTLGLYRTAQEALRNVSKHSRANHVRVELSFESPVVQLRISDDGVGFDTHAVGNKSNANSGLGLVSMQERLRSVGGRLSIWSRTGLGTQIEASVPVVLKKERLTGSNDLSVKTG